jgi:uncharacterized protein
MPPPSHREAMMAEHECRVLLGTCPVGRVAFTEHALPVIYPTHFVVRDDEIVFAALPDGRVSKARHHEVLAFEVDGYNPTTREGWCVSAVGRSRLITDITQVRELDAQQFTPWADNPDRNYVAIEIKLVRGKRMTRVPQPR